MNAEFMVDIEAEEWPEDRDSTSLFRRVQHLYNITRENMKRHKPSTATNRYSEQEDEIIKDAVKGYLKVPSHLYDE